MSCQEDLLDADKDQRLSKLILQKEVKDKVYFLHEHQSCLQIDAVIYVVVARHVQKTQYRKFAVSFQYQISLLL